MDMGQIKRWFMENVDDDADAIEDEMSRVAEEKVDAEFDRIAEEKADAKSKRED
jgi:hypothetical protein